MPDDLIYTAAAAIGGLWLALLQWLGVSYHKRVTRLERESASKRDLEKNLQLVADRHEATMRLLRDNSEMDRAAHNELKRAHEQIQHDVSETNRTVAETNQRLARIEGVLHEQQAARQRGNLT